MNAHPQVFFLHIPKCSGTSVAKHLSEDFYPGFARKVPDGDEFLTDYPGCVEAQVLHGHQFFPFVSLLQNNCDVFTMLRDPVARVVSAFEYIQRKPTHVLHDSMRRANVKTLYDFVQHPDTRYHSVNMQTRMLGVEYDLRSFLEPLLNHTQPVSHIRRQLFALNAAPATPEYLERAKKRLRTISAVGITERFEESMALFASLCGAASVPAAYRENTAPLDVNRWERYDSATLDFVARENFLDVALYNYTTTLLKSRI